MKLPTFSRRLGVAFRPLVSITVLLALAVAPLQADVLIWDAIPGTAGAQDGTGTWTNTGGNWLNFTQTLQNRPWVDGSDAVFGAGSGTAGTITLSDTITAANLTFAPPGAGTYTLGGSGTLILSPNATVTANAPGAISAILSGSSAWTKTGSSTLTLNGATTNTHTGALTVSQGVLTLAKTGGATAVAGNLDITNGAFVTFSSTTTNQISATSAVTMSGEGSVLNGTGPNAGTGNSLNQTLASLVITGGTFNAGAISTWNITGAFSMTGGPTGSRSVFVGNSSAVMNVGSLSLVDMNGTTSSTAVTNGFTLFGNGGSNGTTRMTVGSGGMYLQNSVIYLGAGSTGSLLYLNGDVSTGGTAASSIVVTGTGTQPALGLGTTGTVSRGFNVAGGGADLTVSVTVTNGTATSASLVKAGGGTLALGGTDANTYTGDTTINAGTLRLNKTAGITAVAGNIIVNTGGTLQLSASNQIADTKGITLNGGTLASFTTDETIAFFTQNSGGLASSGNTGHMTVTGALTLAGGTILTINSNTSATPPSWTVGSLSMTGADILMGGNNNTGNPRTVLTIGSGGLTMAGRTITMNAGSAGTGINLNGDFTGTGSNTIANGGGGAVQPLIAIGSATRTFNLLNGTTTIGVEISGTGGSLVKIGPGLLQLTGANSYTGTTTVSGGTLSVAAATGFLSSTAGVVVNGGGILQNGSSTTANNSGIINRINPAATLTLGGGAYLQAAAAAATTTTQSLTGLAISGGANTVTVNALATSTNTLTFSGASPYTRTTGAVNFVQTPASGSTIVFTSAPSGAGNVSGGALVGATLNGTDLVAAQSGTLTAFSGWVPTGTSTWTTGAAMDVTGTNAAAYAGTNVTALRFNTAGPFTVTLAGTHTLDTSVVLMTAAAGAGNSLITGGTLQGAPGGLVLAQNNTAGSLEIASTIADNGGASDVVKSGAGLAILSGTNTYTGVTRVSEGVLRAADGVGLPAASALELNGGVFESTAASFTRALGSGAGQVSMGGASAGFSAAGTAVTANLGGAAATLQWGSASFAPATLLLNASTATAALELANGLDLNGLSRTIRVDAAAANAATISGVISNSASGSPAALTKAGVGTLRLTQANTYDGGTVISGGLIAVGNNQALGAGTVTLNGGGLQADGAARTLANSVVMSGAATVVSAQNLTLTGTFTNSGGNQSLTTTLTGGAVLELAGNVYLSESAAASRVMQIFGTGDRLISGVIANNASDNALASNLFFNSAGNLTLTGVNTYTGRTLSAGGGYIILSQDRSLGATPAAPTVDALILSNNGRIRAASSFTLDANRGIGIGNSSGGAATGQIDVVTNATLTVAGTIADRTFNQDGTAVTAASTGALTKTGAGALVLSGSNTYTGVTTVSNGVLQLNSNNALGATTGGTAITSNGHVLLANGVKITGETLTMGNTTNVNGIAVPGAPTSGRGTLMAAENAKAEWAGNIILGADLSRIGVQEGGTLTISGNITDGANSYTLRIAGELTGTGGVILSGTANAWDGATDVVRGKLILGANNTLPSGTALDIHVAASNNAEYAGVDMNGFNQTIAILRNTGSTGANAELTNSSRTLSTLTLNDTGTNTYAGIITGNVALVKNGAGTLVLTQTNRLTGGLTVNNGLVRISAAGALAEGDVTINGGASSAGKLDLNNVSTAIDALNGSAGTVAAIIANDSTTNATRTLSLGVNHGSGTYAGQIVDNTGGSAVGKIAVAKIGAGTQTLSGTGAYTGGTYVSNGTLVADYAAGSPLGSSAISLQGGTLAIRNASSATIGNVTLVQGGSDFSAGNVLRVEGTGSVTASNFTVNSFAPVLIDLSSGSSFAATTLTGVAMSNGILIGTGSSRANVLVKDGSNVGFAIYNNTSGQITRYTGATSLPSGSTSTSTATNYVVSADLTRSASLNFQTLQIDTSAGSVALNLGSSNITVGNGRVVLVTGTNNASINSTGAVTSGSIFLANHSSGTLTVGISLAAQALVNMGPGLVDYTNSGILGDVYAAGGVLRISGADRDFSASTNVVRIYGGGVLELGADLNGTGTAGAFTRAVGQAAGQVALLGNGGFSAHGADRVVALGGVGTATALTWGASNFLVGASTTTDANYTFMLGSASSTHTVEFQNAIALGSRERRIEVADGTSSTNTDARLTGVLSGTGSVVKEGAGRLEYTAANTYSGTTQVNAGSLVVAAPGRTGTGAVSVASGAALMGTGVVQGSSFTLAATAALHAGNDTAAASIGTLTFQTAAKASFALQSGSLTTLDVATATNAAAVDPSFGGNAIGSAGYNAFVDAFSGTGGGSHDLLVFDGAAGSTLVFSTNLAVRGDALNAAAGQVFNLVDWSSLVAADFSGFNAGANFRTGADDNGLQFDLPELTGGLLWDISRFTTSGVIVVVPEPTRALLVLLGLAGMVWRRRRR